MNKLDILLGLTDLVMLDIKHIDEEKHKDLTGHSNKNILAFAKYLDKKIFLFGFDTLSFRVSHSIRNI